MDFKRFLAWLGEKLIELHLGVVALLLVTSLLPLDASAYHDVGGFLNGVATAWASTVEEATYKTGQYLDGSWPAFVLNGYLAALFSLGWYVYVASLYLLLSLLACALGHRHYRLWQLGAYVAGFAVFCFRFVHVYDTQNLIMGAALFVLGAVIVVVSAGFGNGRAAKAPEASGRRVRLDFSH